ncbi:hypothetical protein BSKO_03813 [Bryopsis sp. KO-2023]|nr:hypothetical protein BSKO_03813 [Bryopsis sp. KO-2023]
MLLKPALRHFALFSKTHHQAINVTLCLRVHMTPPVSFYWINAKLEGRGPLFGSRSFKMPPRKRKSSTAAKGDDDASPPTKKVANKKAPKVKEPFTDDDGWTIHFPNLIYKEADLEPNEKIAAFDLDDTLVKVKSTSKFPKDANDWKFFNKTVPEKLKELVEDGYKLVVFSNQNGIKSALQGKNSEKIRGRVDNFLNGADVSMQVFLAPGTDEMRKPDRGMWDFFVKNCNGGVEPDMDASFFVGDAAGRKGDFSNSDKEFAEGLGLPFKLPEDLFGEQEGKSRVVMEEGSGENMNPKLTDMFDALAEDARENGGDKAHFKANALKKAAKVLKTFPEVIDSDNLKEVGKLAGIGKASVAKIKEFVETGTMEAYESIGGGGGGGGGGGPSGKSDEAPAGKPTSGSAAAMKFMD